MMAECDNALILVCCLYATVIWAPWGEKLRKLMADEICDIEAYLERVGRFCRSGYGKQFRSQFRDKKGTAELAMLAAPSDEEYQQFQRAVAIMTESEKAHPEKLSDEQIKEIAESAKADCGNISIFINGYVLECKKEEDRR